MTNEELYNLALEAIKKLFGDTSVDVAQCRANLETLMDEIEDLLSTLSDE